MSRLSVLVRCRPASREIAVRRCRKWFRRDGGYLCSTVHHHGEMRRVVILGRGGAGKSTLAWQIGEVTGLSVAEQNDEWTESRRYMGLEIHAPCRKAAQPGIGQDITSEAELTVETIPA